MEWSEVYPSHRQPSLDDVAEYIGGEAKELWNSLLVYMDTAYRAKPKMTYSGCTGKPGWNIKFHKSGQSLGTLYPEVDAFSVLIVIGYKFEPCMQETLSELSSEVAELYRQAGDFMKQGRWIMFQIKDQQGFEDYKKLLAVKLRPQRTP